MSVENNVLVSDLKNVYHGSLSCGTNVNKARSVNSKALSTDSVEISSKREDKQNSDWRKVVKTVGFAASLLFLGVLVGRSVQKRRIYNVDRMKKEYTDTLKRPLSEDEIKCIENKCKKSKRSDITGIDVIDCILTACCI